MLGSFFFVARASLWTCWYVLCDWSELGGYLAALIVLRKHFGDTVIASSLIRKFLDELIKRNFHSQFFPFNY